MWTKWYALRKSSFEKTTAPWRGTKAELMRGKGYLFFTVMLFRPRSSIQGHSERSFLLTKKNPAPTGDEDGRMIPAARDSPIYSSMDSRSGQERLNRQLLGRGDPGRRSIAHHHKGDEGASTGHGLY